MSLRTLVRTASSLSAAASEPPRQPTIQRNRQVEGLEAGNMEQTGASLFARTHFVNEQSRGKLQQSQQNIFFFPTKAID